MATAPDHGAILKGDRAAHPLGYVQDSDPGAIGADRPWQDTSGKADGYYTPKTRNEANDGWLTPNATHLGGEPAASFSTAATALAAAKAAMPPSVSFPLGNGDDPIEAGVYYLGVRVPVACTLTDAHLDLDDADDDLEVTVSKAASASPTSYSDVFTLAADSSQTPDDTGRSDAFAAGDRIGIAVTVAATTATQGTLTLTFSRT